MPTNQPSAENVERAGELLIAVGSRCISAANQDLIAQALDEAERRGAVRELRRIVADKEHFGLSERSHEWIAACLCAWANELESATKASGGGG